MADVRVPPHVHATADQSGCLVLLNRRTGQLYALNPTGTLLWYELAEDGDVDRSIGVVVDRYAAVAPERVRGDAEQLLTDLIARGLLEPHFPGAAADGVAARPGRVGTAWADRFAAAVAFPVALLLLRLPFGLTTRLVGLRRRWVTRTATVAEAYGLLAAAGRAARRYPGRAACLELSVTTVIAATLRGRAVDWCLGTATDPRRFHAWVEVDGTSIELPDDEPAGNYIRMIVI
jgi:hypothetical protein